MKKFIISATVAALALNALPALAATTATTTVDTACVQAAVNARDSAIISSLSAYSSTWTAALQTRQSALNAAWAKTNVKTRRAAIVAAWKQYNTSKKAAQTAFNTARKNAWSTFKSAAKTCKMSPADDSTGASVDNQTQ